MPAKVPARSDEVRSEGPDDRESPGGVRTRLDRPALGGKIEVGGERVVGSGGSRSNERPEQRSNDEQTDS
jgi:hypothetical protein